MRLDWDFPTVSLSDADEAVFAAARAVPEPEPAAETAEQTGVPKGTVTEGHHVGTGIWPGVERDYWVYVPARYDAGTEANLIVFQDGRSYLDRTHAATVLDNLIAAGDLKPTVGLFVQPGDLPGLPKDSRGNRSLEYDNVDDAYVRFLLDELMPVALGALAITDDPAGRAICGMSSGGICAFNAAWERPDMFGRVISHVGSYTNIRGGNVYPSRVRARGPKPIRAFLQGGIGDLNDSRGSWAIANFDMAAALSLRGYDMRFEFGLGAHNFLHAAATLPQTLRWIFRD